MKRLISSILLIVMVLSIIPFTAFAAEKTELTLNWTAGYIGNKTNNAKNTFASSTTYSYSDLITIPKAGTKISFTVPAAAMPSHTVWLFSEWKQNGTTYSIDTAGANVSGVGKDLGGFVGQTKNSDGTFTCEFISDHDNQNIRICLQTTAANAPKVYSEEGVSAKTTLQELKDLEFTASLNADGTIKDVKWYCGYASSATNTNGSAKEVRYASAEYCTTGFITIPKKGTKLTWSQTGSANNAYNAVTRYTLNNGSYQYESGVDATSALVTSNKTNYTYVTEYDNEIIRICIRSSTKCTSMYPAAPVTIKWEATTEAGTFTKLEKTDWPKEELISLVTGAPLVATKEVTDLTWVKGYIGSQYHDSAKFIYTSPSNQNYYTSDFFTVPKKGTTVYFFDQTFVDAGGSNYASTSVMTLSHWKLQGPNYVFDQEMPYFNGCDVYNILLTDNYRCYAYTTTEDNVTLRLCMRYQPPFSTEDALIPPVYLVEPGDFDAEQPESTVAPGTAANNKLFDGSYTDAAGAKVAYKYYLPYGGGKAEGQYSLVFDTSADGAVAKYLAENGVKNSIVVAYNGEPAVTLRLLDEVVKGYPVKVSDILFVGDNEIAAHAKRFERIRLANAFLYSGTGTKPAFEHANCKAISEFGSVEEAALWLIREYDNYYDVLESIKMYAIGDSYFGGSGLGNHQTWVNLLGYKYVMTFHNQGIGGNTMATDNTGELGGNQPPMWTRTHLLPTDGDIYFVEGGRNDRRYQVPFGNNDDKTGNTFKGAINLIIDKILESNPDAFIVCVTPWSYKSEVASNRLGTNNDYADAMKEVVEHRGAKNVVCMYAADEDWTGIDMGDAATRQKYCLTASDVSHLNADGMYMVLPIFEKWVAEQYAKYKGVTLVNDKKADLFYPEAADENVDNVTTQAPDNTTAETPKKKGCGGFNAVAVVACVVCGIFGTAIIIKKK